ncbi:MAG TPA: TIGR04282 family arsenosugar biosynthesis glycosyltransferase [Thermoanaerobaculia bacterium]|nr:TIGR04282 family arsenosugar biosynthesis glycosyltransferase [Thermoanaerobaculia bacterium]
MSLSDRRLFLFTKPARPGRVKTRLIGSPPDGLSAIQAAEIHAAFVEDLLDRLRGGAFSTLIAWALDDLPEGEPIPDPYGFPGVRQQGVDLGTRLYGALATAGGTASPEAIVAALGSDHPTLPVSAVEEAFARIERGADVVLGPADDGGYYLIAVRRRTLSPRLFDEIEWSTERVLATTLARAAELNLRVELLAAGTDVDTPADLARLARSLRDDDLGCPRTRALLESWGMLPPVPLGAAR